MLNRVKTKISGRRHRKLKHEIPKTGSSLGGGEDSGSESPKVTALDADASETEIESSHLSGPVKIIQPNFDAPFPGEVENLGDKQHVDAKGARSAGDRLRIASQELNRVIEEYLKANPDATVIEQLQKVHGAISSTSTLNAADTTDALRVALSNLPESMTGRKKRWASSVGNFLSRLYPLTSITLGLAAAGAEVGTKSLVS
jgi:hypothetical protein